jgi:hypothetical protein
MHKSRAFILATVIISTVLVGSIGAAEDAADDKAVFFVQ